MKPIINDKHFSITSAQEIQQIIAPLEKLGINHFNHVRMYPNNSFMLLTNNPGWTKHFLKCQIPGSMSLLDLQTGIYLWHDVVNPRIVADGYNYFNLDNLINFVYTNKNYVDVFAFGTPVTQKSMLSYYFNNLDLFQRFIEYFKNRSSSLFIKSDKERIFIHNKLTNRTNFDFDKHHCTNKRSDILLSIGAIKKQYRLTDKELYCLRYMAHGKNIKEIATFFNNSPRTIETHIYNIKNKTGYFSRSQLIDLYFNQTPTPHYLITK